MDQGGIDAALREWRSSRRPEALGELLKSQRDRAFAIALRLTSSEPEAEDAVQDAFIKLLSRTHGFENVEAFELSVYRAVVQCALDTMRKRRRRTVHEDTVRNEKAGETAVAEARETEGAEHEEARALLRTAVTELPDDERAPVVLCYYQGLSVVQTAKTLELPRETVRARLAKAMDRLRRFLNRNGKDMSAAVIVGLLWRDGAMQAPAGLCAALDKALPGKSCAEVAARAGQFGPAHTAAVTQAAAWTSAAVLAPAALALTLTVAAAAYWLRTPATAAPEAQQPVKTVVDTNPAPSSFGAKNGAASPAAPRSQPGSVEERKEDGPVKSKLTAAVVLMGATMLPAAVQAGEPNGQVASIVAQIASRRADKDAAAATAAQAQANNERGERGAWSTAAPGAANPGPGGSLNGRK